MRTLRKGQRVRIVGNARLATPTVLVGCTGTVTNVLPLAAAEITVDDPPRYGLDTVFLSPAECEPLTAAEDDGPDVNAIDAQNASERAAA